MSDGTGADAVDGAEQVYAAPGEAVRRARSTMSSPTTTRVERAHALWALGRNAYYANNMSDAVRLLRDAVPLVDDPELLTEILLTLAPALSKEGHPDEALQILEDLALELEPKFAGQLRNQRGIILTELNRLPEALAQTEAAVSLLHGAGDLQREARALVNLGAIASVMGRLDDAERWYAEARDLAIATGQDVVASAIVGNLGYIESRRGNFAIALDWYAQARASFGAFEDVGLLEAVLETDHARTLLDIGLAADAADASNRATESATAGGNQMLETQSRLLLGEALIRLGEHRGAEEQIRRSAELARDLGQTAYELRSAYLATELRSVSSAMPASPVAIEDDFDKFLAAGWVREAYEAAIQRAVHLRPTDPAGARAVLVAADHRTKGLDVDRVVRAFGSLLRAECADDHEATEIAFDAALSAIAEQRDLLGSAEMRATIARRVGPIRDVALAAALRQEHPADATLDVLERARAVREAPSSPARPTAVNPEQLARLRDARVLLEEAKIAGSDVRTASAAVRSLELEALARRRATYGHVGSSESAADVVLAKQLPSDTAYVTFALDQQRLVGITHAKGATTLVRLGQVSDVLPLIRAQRTALRHLADERRPRLSMELQRLLETSKQLDAALLGPLDIGWADRLVVTPAIPLRDVAWAALPSIRDRAMTLAPTLRGWTSDAGRIRVRRMAFLGGPGLADGDELDSIAHVWQRPDAVVSPASCDEAAAALRRADLVHIAAHGAFRTDNPFFSSLIFSDGHLSVLEMTELDAVPAVVMLASCDAGSAAAASTGTDPMIVGTATELRNLGARVVIAPSVSVNDAAAADLSLLVHERMARGESIDESVVGARTALWDDGEPARCAAAAAFQLFGGQATQASLSRWTHG